MMMQSLLFLVLSTWRRISVQIRPPKNKSLRTSADAREPGYDSGGSDGLQGVSG
jgi:hypothetical protein